MKNFIVGDGCKAIAVIACLWTIVTATRVYDISFYQSPMFFALKVGLGSAAFIYFVLLAARRINERRFNAANK